MKTWTCPSGTFCGSETEDCYHLSGIRYAESERFCNPTAYRYPEGVHVCRDNSPYAVQLASKPESYLFGMDYTSMKQEEACQYLSITIPKTASADAKLPVMVWIHGGAFRNGGCDNNYYDSSLLASEGNVIVVKINYRLGVLGFVKDKNGKPANPGLLDVIAALQWIQNNIESFGGDRKNVTLFGQSAGAQAIAGILVADGTDELFKNAIMESTPLGAMENRQAMDAKLLDEMNMLPDDATTDEVRQKQGEILEHITEKGTPKYMPFAPHYGIEPLPAEDIATERLRERASRHSLLIGCNARETSAYIGNNKTLSALYSSPLTRWLLEAVLKKKTNGIFADPSKKFAADYAKAGGASWYYTFSWGCEQSMLKACHCMEMILLFGWDNPEGQNIAMGMSKSEIVEEGKKLRSIWYEFAKTGEVTQLEIPEMISIKKQLG